MERVSPEQRKLWVEQFVKNFILTVDVYCTSYCGYWLRGEGRIDSGRWLAVDMIEVCESPSNGGEILDLSKVDERSKEVVQLYLNAMEVPEGWYALDQEIGEKAYAIGERRWGERWYPDKGDSNTYDVVLQEALLGEVKYS